MALSNKTIVGEVYSKNFGKLAQIARDIDELKKISNNLPNDENKQQLSSKLAELENELKGYATALQEQGTELVNRVA